MRKRVRFVFLTLLAAFLVLLGATTPVRAGGMTEGLAVAVTADGTRLVAGGSNRALYELDPATLAVKRRVWLGRRVMNLVFSPDGKVLVVESTSGVQWLKADTLEPFQAVEDAHSIRSVPALDAVAMVVPDYHEPAVRVFGFADATERAAVVYDPRRRAAAYGVSPDGKRLAILEKRQKDESEETITGRKIPEELRKEGGAALAEFQQRHDGWSTTFRVFDLASAEQRFEKKLWFTSEGSDLVTWHGEDAYVIGYRNHGARITPEGEITVFALGNGLNQAYYASPDGKAIWTGGSRDGARTLVPGLASASFEIDEVEGFNEQFKAFTTAADGTAFAGTTAFRVLRLGADGRLQRIAPVY